MAAERRDAQSLSLRALGPDDAAAVQQAVIACPPLTLHTPYTYWVMLGAQRGMCVGAYAEDELAAFALSLHLGPERLFVWQIGVLPAHRGRNLGVRLLGDLWGRARQRGIDRVETTIAPDNVASRLAFERFAITHGLVMRRLGDALCSDADGLVAEAENWFRLS